MAEDKVFLVEGEIIEKRGKKRFSKEVRARTAGFAAEKAVCLFGSKNRLKRNQVMVKETKEVQKNEGK